MGAVFWYFPIRASRSLPQAEYEAEEQAYREECVKLIDATQHEGKDDAARRGSSPAQPPAPQAALVPRPRQDAPPRAR